MVTVPPHKSHWTCAVRGSGGSSRLVVVQSAAHPDGTWVEVADDAAAREIGDHAWAVVALVGHRVVRAEPTPLAAPKAPPLWFAELRESNAQPPAVALVAFTGHGQSAGTLLDQGDLSNVDVSSVDQLGALRWYPATGEVDQVYVQPQWRRRSIASALIAVGAGISIGRGWPRLWGDGQRTEMGEALRNASSWQHRAAPLTHVAPPMTPVTAATDRGAPNSD